MENQPQSKPDHGQTLLTWGFPEYVQHQRSRAWWVLAGLAIAGLVYYAIATGNYLFGVIIALAAGLFLSYEYRQPREIAFSITEDGLALGQAFYAWERFVKFWLVYQPPEVKTLFVDFKGIIRPHLAVPLQTQNPLQVRELLRQYLTEDLERTEEPVAEALARTLKL